ncbi:hypothetical protein BS78_08G166300 [Paspalum vaginatum]|nr:hypothetical protein BS78_08G166300 [Paspalum vaginatum]
MELATGRKPIEPEFSDTQDIVHWVSGKVAGGAEADTLDKPGWSPYKEEMAVVSASSITTLATTGSHVLKINGYSAGKHVINNGCYVDSCEFEAAGHTWCVRYYPNGDSRDAGDHISLFLKLARNVDNGINARFRFILVPQQHMPGKKKTTSTLYSDRFVSFEFGRTTTNYLGRTVTSSSCHGLPRFIRRDVLEKSEYLSDDCFTIRCDIAVLETSSATADPPAVEAHDMLRLGDLHQCNKRLRRGKPPAAVQHDGGACTWCTDVLCNCNCSAAKEQRRLQSGFRGACFRFLACMCCIKMHGS